jgi:hypothetical protein
MEFNLLLERPSANGWMDWWALLLLSVREGNLTSPQSAKQGPAMTPKPLTRLDDLDAIQETLHPTCECCHQDEIIGLFPPFGRLCAYDLYRIVFLLKTGDYISRQQWKAKGSPNIA